MGLGLRLWLWGFGEMALEVELGYGRSGLCRFEEESDVCGGIDVALGSIATRICVCSLN